MTIVEPNLQAIHSTSRSAGRTASQSTHPTSRILSETAHDLRSPLASVRESIRVVADGAIGPINEMQFQVLIDAVDVCDSMQRLVADMLQLERLEAGRARATRSWFDLLPLRHSVNTTLAATLRARHISIIWDGIETATPRVFGDPDKICRLLTNLISNAARETAEHRHVMVRAKTNQDGDTLRLSVIDSGRGMNPQEWIAVADRGVSQTGGEGLGLSICRQLASAHHSALTILSRVGTGTEISFELPIGGAVAVANHWTRWRSQHSIKITPRRRTGDQADTQAGAGAIRSFALDDSELSLMHYEGPPPRHPATCVLMSVTAGAALQGKAIATFDERLHRDQLAYDLVYRIAERRWVVVWDANEDEAIERAERLSTPDRELGVLRVNWSTPRVVRLDNHQATTTIADTLTREALTEREPVGMIDDDMIGEGKTKFAPSAVPAQRLQAELAYLAGKAGLQSKSFLRQALRFQPTRRQS